MSTIAAQVHIATALLGAILLFSADTASGAVPDPFNVGERRARTATVLTPTAQGQGPVAEAPMAWTLAGVIAQLDQSSMRTLFRCVNRQAARPEAPANAQVAYRLRLVNGPDSVIRSVLRDREGNHWLLVDDEGSSDAAFPLVSTRFHELSAEWPKFRGSVELESTSVKLGEVFDVERPFESSPYSLDAQTLRKRVFGRHQSAFGASNVDLGRSQFAARLPMGYDPSRPSGLIVWATPSDQWRVPEQLHQALDELNFVCIGALNSGNERPPPNRMQLALHATEIAQSRWHIDPRRIYVTGMSGGAKIATMLWAGFPEVYSGAIPIVGLASYKNTPTGEAGKHWPAVFSRPDARRMKMLRDRPLAPMTGPPDFNYKNMVPMAAGLERDGLPVKMFIYEEMAHVMPQPAHFVEALRWVDEPYQASRQAEIESARAALEAYRARFGDGPPETDGQRAQLGAIMEQAPWSDPAWEAYRLLVAQPMNGATPES